MHFPNRTLELITQEKLVDYLLNTEHKRGGTKGRLLERFGYTFQNWGQLEAGIRTGLEPEADVMRATEDGTRYEIRMTLQTPRSLPLTLRTIWQVDGSTDVPRLITLYPD